MTKKVALCLHGYFNNRADPHSGANGYLYIKNNLLKLDACNVDVFIHSWEKKREKQLKKVYNPKDCIFEEQIDFSKLMIESGISNEYYNAEFDRNGSIFSACKIESTLSFLYSRKKSIELVPSGYDCVITARFDLGQRDKDQQRKYHVSTMNFFPDADMNYFYSAMWDQMNAGYADQWFYSSLENMKKVASVYDLCYKAFLPKSEYEKCVTGGWFDSQEMDNLSVTDPRQFSNEMFKDEKDRAKNLMKYPLWQCINNHLYYKWALRELGLYEKSRFV